MNTDRPIEYTAEYQYAYLRGTVDCFLAGIVPLAHLRAARERLRFLDRARAVSEIVRDAARAERAR